MMLKDDGELIIKALSKDKSVLLNDFYNPEPVSSSPKVYCDYYIDDRNIGTPLTDKGYVD